MQGPLAYAFWHQPADPTAPSAGYEQLLVEFHRALAEDPPPGFAGSWTLRLPRPPWLPTWPSVAAPGADATVYLDWYVVDGLGGLERLADAAVDHRRRATHDAAATHAGPGAGGLYRLVAGPVPAAAPDPARPVPVGFADTRRGDVREQAAAALGGDQASVWMRQLVLGPGPEWVVLGGRGPGWPPDGWAVEARLAAW